MAVCFFVSIWGCSSTPKMNDANAPMAPANLRIEKGGEADE